MVEDKAEIEIDDWLTDLEEDQPDALEEEAPGELDQSDIDALLGGGGPAESAPALGGEDNKDANELDQSDIDSLFGGGKDSAAEAGADAEIDQADIDDLFSGVGEGVAGKPETASSLAVDQGVQEEDSFALPDKDEFDDDEFDFGDLPDIPDEINTGGIGEQGGKSADELFALAAGAGAPDFSGKTTMDADKKTSAASGGKDDHPVVPPSAGGKKKMLGIAAFCLVLLLGGGGGYWYMMKNGQGELPVPAQEQPVAVAPPAPAPVAPPPTNVAPVAIESSWRMKEPNEALTIELVGTDENNDPLKFEIVTTPKFGRLSGDLPKITYLPNKDFPGEDSFEFLVSDGQLASAPAKVGIMGPESVKSVVKEAEKDVPVERPVVAAKNMRLKTLSTAPLIINWKKIWAAANPAPFDAKVSIEILDSQPLRGVLRLLDRSRHSYEPDRYFGGKEVVRYRFKAAGIFSPIRELVIEVKPNDKPPVLVLRPIADSHKVGEIVVLDAGLTRDDSPGGVQYSWEQLAGMTVPLTKLHKEGSAVSFVAPAFFRSEQKNRIVIRVTATDSGGQSSSKEIAVNLVSKRKTALWGIAE